jgi:6-phosphofructokinase 1
LDRILATRLGANAVDVLKRGDGGKMVGLIANQVEIFPLEHAWQEKKEIDLGLYQLSQIMAI